MLSTRLLQNVVLIGVLAVLLLGVLWAFVAGSRAGQSAVIVKNTQAIDAGLKYFLADQNRFPTAVEFQDRNTMGNYLTGFPPAQITSGSCPQTYQYSSPTAKTFELDVCLPKAAAGFAVGWNKINQQ